MLPIQIHRRTAVKPPTGRILLGTVGPVHIVIVVVGGKGHTNVVCVKFIPRGVALFPESRSLERVSNVDAIQGVNFHSQLCLAVVMTLILDNLKIRSP